MAELRVGVDIPYLAHPSEVRTYVQTMEDLGFHHLGFSAHLASTTDTVFPGPMFSFDEPWHETFTMASYVAGLTSRIEINTAMLLLPLYHPVLAAKQAAEVQLLSENRLRIGASISWNPREAEALGVDPATRGARFEEQVVLMRRLWTERAVDHEGRFFTLRQTGISPRPATPPAIWFGAGVMSEGAYPSPLAIDRAARLADGYKYAAPSSFDQDRLARSIDELRAAVVGHGRDVDAFGIEVRMAVQAVPEEEWPAAVQRAKALGATHLGVSNRIAGGSVTDQIAVCRRFVESTRDQW